MPRSAAESSGASALTSAAAQAPDAAAPGPAMEVESAALPEPAAVLAQQAADQIVPSAPASSTSSTGAGWSPAAGPAGSVGQQQVTSPRAGAAGWFRSWFQSAARRPGSTVVEELTGRQHHKQQKAGEGSVIAVSAEGGARSTPDSNAEPALVVPSHAQQSEHMQRRAAGS